MRHTPQRCRRDCGLAVAATLAGVTYERIMAIAGATACQALGTSADELKAILAALTGRPWTRPELLHGDTVEQLAWRYLARGAALVVRSHWIAVASGLVFDPATPAPRLVALYPGRLAAVVDALVPLGGHLD